MKLKHLFLAALAVGALASCSDDGNGPEIPEMILICQSQLRQKTRR